MNVLDVVEIWATSVERLVGSVGGSIAVRRSPGDRLNDSIHVVIVRGDQEAEVILWESGEADFARVDGDSVAQQHFENAVADGLGPILRQLLDVLD